MPMDPRLFLKDWRPDQTEALERLKKALQEARGESGWHGAWARICEDAGQDGLAFTEYQVALRDNPNDASALERLAILYRERGQHERALECAERRVQAQPADAGALRELLLLYLETEMGEQAEAAIGRARASGMPGALLAPLEGLIRSAARAADGVSEEEEKVASALGTPSDADVIRFAHLFSGRENVYARQWWNESGEGGYTPIRQPLVFQVARNHLLGSITVGVYPVRLDNTVVFFAIDIDINKRAIARARGDIQESRSLREKVSAEARRLQAALAELSIAALLEDSGYKGRHLWIFLQEPAEAAVVRQFGALFLALWPLDSADLRAEFFPKQAATGSGGIGNLIKLPLGIHRRTGRRGRLLLPDGAPDPDPFGTLRSIKRVSRDSLVAAIIGLKARRPGPPAMQSPEAPEPSESPALPQVPAPPAPPAAWTAGDFETHPEISHLFRGCHVISALREKVEKHRRLSHEEQVVLIHSLGHSAAGVLAANYLFDACIDVPGEARMRTPLSGNPISCPKIRKRIPHITGQTDCNCAFDFAPDHYPTPILHLQAIPKPASLPVRAAPEWDPEERARALGVLRLRRARLEQEIVEMERDLVNYLERSGKDRIELNEGALVLHHEEGALPSLHWQPEDSSPKAIEAQTQAGGSETNPPDA